MLLPSAATAQCIRHCRWPPPPPPPPHTHSHPPIPSLPPSRPPASPVHRPARIITPDRSPAQAACLAKLAPPVRLRLAGTTTGGGTPWLSVLAGPPRRHTHRVVPPTAWVGAGCRSTGSSGSTAGPCGGTHPHIAAGNVGVVLWQEPCVLLHPKLCQHANNGPVVHWPRAPQALRTCPGMLHVGPIKVPPVTRVARDRPLPCRSHCCSDRQVSHAGGGALRACQAR